MNMNAGISAQNYGVISYADLQTKQKNSSQKHQIGFGVLCSGDRKIVDTIERLGKIPEKKGLARLYNAVLKRLCPEGLYQKLVLKNVRVNVEVEKAVNGLKQKDLVFGIIPRSLVPNLLTKEPTAEFSVNPRNTYIRSFVPKFEGDLPPLSKKADTLNVWVKVRNEDGKIQTEATPYREFFKGLPGSIEELVKKAQATTPRQSIF